MSKLSLLAKLRSVETDREQFRAVTLQLASLLAADIAARLPTEQKAIQTPLTTTTGEGYSRDLMLLPVLRAGIAFLPPFLLLFPRATLGMIGVKRCEKSSESKESYCKLSRIGPNQDIVVLEPMIATGRSSALVVNRLIGAGALESNIYFASALAAPTGLQKLSQQFPQITVICAQVDEGLDENDYIIPGLGDFGDRFFGTD